MWCEFCCVEDVGEVLYMNCVDGKIYDFQSFCLVFQIVVQQFFFQVCLCQLEGDGWEFGQQGIVVVYE